MYLWGTEWGQQGHFGGTLTLLGAVQQQSPAQALGSCAGSSQGCGDPRARSRDEVAVGRWRQGCSSCGTAQQMGSGCRSAPCQPNEL